MSSASPTAPPVSQLDPFSDKFPDHPYPGHQELRESSHVVRPASYRVRALVRHKHVAGALTDPAKFWSYAGVGLANLRKEIARGLKSRPVTVTSP